MADDLDDKVVDEKVIRELNEFKEWISQIEEGGGSQIQTYQYALERIANLIEYVETNLNARCIDKLHLNIYGAGKLAKQIRIYCQQLAELWDSKRKGG